MNRKSNAVALTPWERQRAQAVADANYATRVAVARDARKERELADALVSYLEVAAMVYA